MSRAAGSVSGVLLLLLALLPFVPHGGAIRRRSAAGDRTGRAADRRLRPDHPGRQHTIDRSWREGSTAGRTDPAHPPRTLVDDAVRCATFEGQRYCLGTG